MIEAIVLAAGLSSRMGAVNKLTLPFQGKPILTHTIEALLRSNIDKIIVITGHESKTIESLLKADAVRIIYNPNYTKGQLTSIQEGLFALSDACTSFMICLSDMPLLTTNDYNELIATYENSSVTKPIVLPEKAGRKGNPKIFHRDFASQILALDPHVHQGAKAIIQEYKHNIVPCTVSHDRFFIDIDELQDYYRLEKR